MSKLVPIHVEIDNFQSIASAKIEIRGLTCISGRSNIGKSAVLRALSSCLLNLPVVGMVRKGTPHVRVKINDGKNEILWEKGEKKTNRYHINGKLYDKVERKQLPAITEMGYSSVEIGDSRIQPWWASQFEPIFLLNKTGPQVTDFVSEMSRLQTVQNAIVLSARGKKKEADATKNTDEDIIEQETMAEKFEDCDKLEPLWKDIQDQRDSILEYEERLGKMKAYHLSFVSSKEKIESFQGCERAKVPEYDYSGLLETRREKIRHHERLQLLTRDILTLRNFKDVPELELAEEEHARYVSLQKFSALPKQQQAVDSLLAVEKVSIPEDALDADCTRLASMESHHATLQRHTKAIRSLQAESNIPEVEELSETISKHEKMQSLSREIAVLRKNISAQESELSQADTELSSVMSELAEFPTCPTCGQELQYSHASAE